MQSVAKIYDSAFVDRYSGPAKVISFDENRDLVKVLVETRQVQVNAWARLIRPLADTLNIGDEVLVIGDSKENLYVVGLLEQKPFDTVPKLILPDGTCATITGSDKAQKLCVYSNRKELLFEYDPGTKKARIVSDARKVVLDAPKGDIELKAAKDVRLSGQHIELAGRSGVKFSVGQMFEGIRSALSLKPGKINISGQNLQVSASRGLFSIEEARANIKKAVNRIGYAKLVVDRLETMADSIIEKAKSAYRSTENLNQLKAGRVRMLIDSTFHLKSKSSILKAKDDLKVKGERIHLG